MKKTSQFDKHLREWLIAMDVPTGDDPVDWTVRRAKCEILQDVLTGILPATVKSFADLHNYVDANGYGGAFRWPQLLNDTEDEQYVVSCSDFWNKVHSHLDEWIASGRMLAKWQGPGSRDKTT